MPQISVIVPVYKVEPYIHRCVDSILAQTYTDFELILVDDGSPDNCPAICDEYKEKDGRVVVIHQKNGGLSAARNTGIDWVFENSNSEWLSFIDSDDWVDKDFLKLMIKGAVEEHTEAVVCKSIRATMMVQESESTNKIQCDNKRFCELSVDEYYRSDSFNRFSAWGKIYKKSLFKDIRYPVGRLHEDLFTTHRIIEQLDRITLVDCSLYYYYYNQDSITLKQWSPNRLDELKGARYFIKYMEDKHHHDIAIIGKRRMAVLLAKQLDEIKEMDNKRFIYYLFGVRLHMKCLLISNFRILSFKENEYYYNIAFPRIMHLYWTIKSIKEKRINK